MDVDTVFQAFSSQTNALQFHPKKHNVWLYYMTITAYGDCTDQTIHHVEYRMLATLAELLVDYEYDNGVSSQFPHFVHKDVLK